MPWDLVVKNASKIRSMSSGSIPVPESSIDKSTSPAQSRRPHFQDPWPVGHGAHRIDRVGDEVQDDLLQLAFMRGYRGKLRGKRNLHADARRLQFAADDRDRLADHLVQASSAVSL